MKRALSTAMFAMLAVLPAVARADVAKLHVAPNATFQSGILRVERFGRQGRRPIVFVHSTGNLLEIRATGVWAVPGVSQKATITATIEYDTLRSIPIAVDESTHREVRRGAISQTTSTHDEARIEWNAVNDISSVDEYIALQAKAVQPVLRRVRSAIRRAIPNAAEVLSYGMPTYKLGKARVLYFAAWRAHYALYGATADVLKALKSELARYRIEKGTIQFPLSEPVPVKLIERIARLRARAAEKPKRGSAG